MRKILIAALLMLVSATSFADNNAAALSGAQAGSAAIGSYMGANSGNTNVAGTDMSSMVPNVSAPNLATTLTETCMGSSSVGASGAGFGFSVGSTWRDGACVRRLDSRQIAAYGEIAVAVEMMCDSDLVREAAIRAGRPCVADGGHPRGIPVAAIQEQVQIVPTPEAAAPVVTQTVHE